MLAGRHEIIGIITSVGPKVKKFKVGDRAGVGCLVDSCQECEQCTKTKEEQFCAKAVQTYNMKNFDGTPTYGGYSTQYVLTERYNLTEAACLTCLLLVIAETHSSLSMRFYAC